VEEQVKRSVRVGFVLVTVLVALTTLLTWPTNRDFYLGGIQVNEADHKRWVERLDEVGMNTVAVTVYAKQGDWDSENLWWEEEEPWVVAEIRTAREQGLEAILVLRVALDHAFERNKFFWHGMIMPATEPALEEWFDRYRNFVLKWAEIAEREGVAVLAVGSEMNALASTVEIDTLPALEEYWANEEKVARENAKLLRHGDEVEPRHLAVRGFPESESLDLHLDERSLAHAAWARQVSFLDQEDYLERINRRRRGIDGQWRRLIRETRSVYSGRLTYAANFDQFESVGFWETLDLVSINAYFSLRKMWQPGVTPEELLPVFEARWASILRSIRESDQRLGWGGKSVLFTELGYVYRRDSTIEPWNSTGFSVLSSVDGEKLVVWEDQPIDLKERAMAVRALHRASRTAGAAELEGILYWKLSSHAYHFDDEPFVLIIEEGVDDPMLDQLQRFRRWAPWNEARARLARAGLPLAGP
jgi:hypothetical protein